MDPVPASRVDGRSFARYTYGNSSPYVYVDPDGRHNGRANPNPSFTDLTPEQKLMAANNLIEAEDIELHRGIQIGSPGSRGATIIGNKDGGSVILGDTEFVTRSKLYSTLDHEAGHENVEAPATNERELALEEAALYQTNIDNASEYGSTPEEVEFFETERDKARARAEASDTKEGANDK